MSESQIFNAARKLSASQRHEYLEQVCESPTQLRLFTELLEAYDELNATSEKSLTTWQGEKQSTDETFSFGSEPALQSSPTLTALSIGHQVGPFTLISLLGAGGMGQVWKAEQATPVVRTVALKLMTSLRWTPELRVRFEAERQAMAAMNHPNIALILESGRSHEGLPYYAMELVDGPNLLDYCDRRKLSIEDRLRLFIDVCHGVQHAHQKGVIHRDLKPQNILVLEADGRAIPKVIDFGLAKVVEAIRSDAAGEGITAFGQVLGTYRYMSPEQASFSHTDIDTRTDVYSLGAILHELLTGDTPLSRQVCKQHSLPQLLELIRESTLVCPSQNLSNLQPSDLLQVAQLRGTDTSKLNRELATELDWIVVKSLEKDRAQRYDSASSLAADITRYLNHETLEARPYSWSYRARKFTQRYRTQVMTASALLLVLVVGLIGTTWGLVLASQRAASEQAAKIKAEEASTKASQALAAEAQANATNEKQLAMLQRNNEILGSVFEELDIEDIRQGTEPLEAVLAQKLISAAELLEKDSVGEPLEVSQLQLRLARSLISLGFEPTALELLKKVVETRRASLPADDPDTLVAMHNLAKCHSQLGNHQQAIDLFRHTYELRRSRLGEEHQLTLASFAEIASSHAAANDWKAAIPIYEDALKLLTSALGSDHRDTLAATVSLATAYRKTGAVKQALPLLEKTLASQRVSLGEKHTQTISTMGSLAAAYMMDAQHDRGLELMEQAWQLSRETLGEEHPRTMSLLNNLATSNYMVNKIDKALPLFEQLLVSTRKKLGPKHENTLLVMGNLASVYLKEKRFEQSIALMQEVLDHLRSTSGPEHFRTITPTNNLASAYILMGKPELALPLLEQAAAGLQQCDFKHENAMTIMGTLFATYAKLGQTSQSEKMRSVWLDSVRQRFSESSVEYAREIYDYAKDLLAREDWQQAEKYTRQYIKILEEITAQPWLRFEAQSMLGAAIMGRAKQEADQYPAAEQLLVAGYQGLQVNVEQIPKAVRQARLTQAIDRLIRLFTELGKAEEVTRWTTEKEELLRQPR